MSRKHERRTLDAILHALRFTDIACSELDLLLSMIARGEPITDVQERQARLASARRDLADFIRDATERKRRLGVGR